MADEQETVDVEVVEEEPLEEIQSAELVIREEREQMPAPASVLPSPKEWEATLAVAAQVAATPFVPESYRGKPESVVAAILTGREMGIGPMQSMRQIHMIDGRPAFAADLMLAKMRQGGVVILESSIDDERAYIKAQRRGTGEIAEVEWTYAEAEKIMRKGKSLASGANWQNYRQDMLWARCVGRLARRLGSDLLGGLVYSKEEIEDWGESDYGGSYGVGDGYEATPSKPFDPETDLMDGAISGEDAPSQIAAALNEMEPTVNWPDFLALVVNEVYDKPNWRELEPQKMQDFWRRLSNATHWMRQVQPHGAMPPIEEEKIADAFARAFSGLVIEVPYIDPPPRSDESIPFGDEEQGSK